MTAMSGVSTGEPAQIAELLQCGRHAPVVPVQPVLEYEPFERGEQQDLQPHRRDPRTPSGRQRVGDLLLVRIEVDGQPPVARPPDGIEDDLQQLLARCARRSTGGVRTRFTDAVALPLAYSSSATACVSATTARVSQGSARHPMIRTVSRAAPARPSGAWSDTRPIVSPIVPVPSTTAGRRRGRRLRHRGLRDRAGGGRTTGQGGLRGHAGDPV